MKKLLITLSCCVPLLVQAQQLKDWGKKQLKFATFYTAVTGNNSLADISIYSINPTTGILEENIESTPFDYTLAFGVRKIARLDYENRKNVFYNGTETSVSDAATVGNVEGLEYLFEFDYKRQQGSKFVDQQHFLRYVHDHWILKTEYVQDGFADLRYFEASQRYRYNIAKEFSRYKNVKIVSGINLSMLLNIFNYPNLDLNNLTNKAIEGGRDGVIEINNDERKKTINKK